jgi:hypothetical protein
VWLKIAMLARAGVGRDASIEEPTFITVVCTFGDWMERAQGRDRWRALVSTVMNFRVP